jgi:hypothetical protein
MDSNTKKAKFYEGKVAVTQGIGNARLDNDPFFRFIKKCLNRHISGDWGNCCKEDRETNDDALKNDARLFSVYKIPKTLGVRKEKIWIITEADRSSTTILFPSEY